MCINTFKSEKLVAAYLVLEASIRLRKGHLKSLKLSRKIIIPKKERGDNVLFITLFSKVL